METRIIELRPETEYQGTTYEQTVVGELSNGTILCMFDNDLEVAEKFVGQTLELSISLLTPSEELPTAADIQRSIEPNSEAPRDFTNHVYRGCVQQIDESESGYFEAEFDVGVGSVLLHLYREHNPDLSCGDCLVIEASRTDVSGVIEPTVE